MKSIDITMICLLSLLISGCDLGVDYGGFFSSYSTPDSRFNERESLAMHSETSTLETMALTSGKLSFSFAIVSDIHVQDSLATHLDQFINDLLSTEDAFILDCGDSTQSGYESQLITYKTFMNSSTLPWFAALGNHDLYYEGWKNYRDTIGRSVYSFGIGNSSDPGSTYVIALDSANSTLGTKQLSWLESTLIEQDGLWDHLIVFTHSQFFSDGITTVVQFTNSEEIYKLMYLFKTYGADYVFMGHNHSWNSQTVNNIKYITLDPLQKENSDDSFVRVTVDGSDISHERIMIPDL